MSLNLSADDTSVLPLSLVASTTAGGTSFEFTVPERGHVTIVADGLGAGEEVNLQALKANGTGWVTILDGTWPLTNTANASAVWAKGRYRVVQDATVGATTTEAYINTFKSKGF